MWAVPPARMGDRCGLDHVGADAGGAGIAVAVIPSNTRTPRIGSVSAVPA